MENFRTPFSATMSNTNTTTTTSTEINPMQPNMGCSQNPEFFVSRPLSFPSTSTTSITSSFHNSSQHRPPHEDQQFPHGYPFEQAGQLYPAYPFWPAQNGVEIGMSNSIPTAYGVYAGHDVRGSCFSQRSLLDAQLTKIARSKRKMARQRSLSLARNSFSGASSDTSSSSTRWATRKLTMHGPSTDVQNGNTTNANKDLYNFCTPDNKKLRMLLKKVLKNSDVGSLGRIVIPKVEAEKNLPILSDKEGIAVVIRDAYSDEEWSMRYKYWTNNRSRMYVLENTGDFVKERGLEIGDSLNLYEDESKNLFWESYSWKRFKYLAAPATARQ